MWTRWDNHLAGGVSDTVKRSAVWQDRAILDDRYMIGAPCAGVGPGRFYRGHEPTTGKEVAVRVLPLRSPPPSPALTAARQAVRRCATSPHPHITRTFEIAQRNDALIVVTEPRGSGLHELWQARHPEISAALTMGRQICGALAYIHAHHETYGLLAPDSIELTIRGTARLADVGMAPLADYLCDALPAEFFTDPGYLAPEQERGAAPDPAMDVYHLGVLLWKLLQSALPADAGDELLPPLLRDVLARCLSADPGERPLDLIAISDSLRLAQRQMEGSGSPHAMARVQIMRRRTQPLEEAEPAVPALPPASRTNVALSLPDWSSSSPGWAMSSPSWSVLEARLSGQSASQPEEPDLTTYHPAIEMPAPPAISLAKTHPRPIDSESSQPESARQAKRRPSLIRWMRSRATGVLKRLHGGRTRRKMALVSLFVVALVAMVAVVYGTGIFASDAAPPATHSVILGSGTTTLTGRAAPYHVLHTLTVDTNQALRVLAGATVTFAPGTGIIVRGGTLAVEGTSAAPVVFTADGDPALGGTGAAAGVWLGIHSLAGADGTPGRVSLQNVSVRFAGVPGGAAIACDAGALTLDDSLQSDSAGSGLVAASGCWGEVARTTFERDAGDAAIVTSSALRFSNNVAIGSVVSLP